MSSTKNSLAMQRIAKLLDENSFVELGSDKGANDAPHTIPSLLQCNQIHFHNLCDSYAKVVLHDNDIAFCDTLPIHI